ncbi:HD domain-containing phosphohydrolase [Magnetospira sp. QH-2]|uniref:HD domain-containing phosphohydrolase n=1 Tax=Magnetospira sp. (strain QH-2) TaxID=1288970 RepID=UPI0003E818E5|nr:HD domain-containing phosphohydrolase [Magnetospira sp. QH-2]CCQ74907.1 putative response regulator receiver modulated metal dependent phosphohydrolase [Magnetospira sp. QH-2]
MTTAPPAPTQALDLTTARILIVDDNPVNVALLEEILEDEGYSNIQTSTDSPVGLNMFEQERHDLVLLDIRMPDLDGHEFMASMRELLGGDYLPVIVLTAQIDVETKHRALEAGARDFLTKPFDRVEVLHRIRNMLEVRLLYKERQRQNEHLEDMVRQRTRELEATRLEIIRRLGRAGEYRDNETGMHVIRMSKSCQVLALAAGLGEETAEMILQASPMHDVGKIGIPDNILLKPGKLEGEEWEIMKTHAEIGGSILGEHDSPIMSLASSIALCHHEKWDGTGYPNGLKGEEIPIEGRIAAVADVFDALTSERPYKKGWSVADALNFINEQSGKQFDPKLVVLFNENLDAILEIREQYADPGQSD